MLQLENANCGTKSKIKKWNKKTINEIENVCSKF